VPRKGLSASLEDYLEAIYQIIGEQQAVRCKDIAARLGVTSASVTGALRALAERGLVNYAPYGVITLTRDGRRQGRRLVRTHKTLRDFLVKVLAVAPRKADATACGLEHAMPPDVLERLVQFVEFMDICPRVGAVWVDGFGYHCKDRGHLTECSQCVNADLEKIRQHRLAHEDSAGR